MSVTPEEDSSFYRTQLRMMTSSLMRSLLWQKTSPVFFISEIGTFWTTPTGIKEWMEMGRITSWFLLTVTTGFSYPQHICYQGYLEKCFLRCLRLMGGRSGDYCGSFYRKEDKIQFCWNCWVHSFSFVNAIPLIYCFFLLAVTTPIMT